MLAIVWFAWLAAPTGPGPAGPGIFTWGAAPAAAQTAPTPPPEAPADESTVVAVHDRVSETVSDLAARLDKFFGDDRHETEANRTRVKLKLDTFLEEGEGLELSANFVLKLVMPSISDRLHFIASRGQAPGTLDFDDEEVSTARQRLEVSDDDNLIAALRYFLWQRTNRTFAVEGGLGYLHSGDAVGFTSLRYRELFDFDPWALRFTQKLGVFTGPGWGTSSQLDLDRKVFGDMLFRMTNQVGYISDEDDLFYDLKFKLVQPLSDIHGLEYKWENYFNFDRTSVLDETVAIVNYRHRLIWDWLYYEIAPQISFPRKNDYEATPGIMFRLEIKFGREYLSYL